MPSPFQTLTCEHCGREFQARSKGPLRALPRWCSRSCVWWGTRGHEYNRTLAEVYAASNADKRRGTGTKGYVKRGGWHEHRAVLEGILGRPLTFQEVVHHKDGNKHNNDPSNLEVMTRAEHMRQHGIGTREAALLHQPWKKRWPKRNESTR